MAKCEHKDIIYKSMKGHLECCNCGKVIKGNRAPAGYECRDIPGIYKKR